MISGNLWLMRVSTTIGGGERMINIDTPGDWADVTNPFTVNGNVPISPFENTLGYRIYLPDKTLVNELKGYREYAHKTRYKIFPYIW